MILREMTSYTYSYDAASNITVSGSGTLTYDTNNRLISNNGQNITYDADGNMTSAMLNGTTAPFARFSISLISREIMHYLRNRFFHQSLQSRLRNRSRS